MQRLLWTPNTQRLCENSRLKITPVFPLGLTETLLEESLNPYQSLQWAKKQPELKKLCRVSAHTPGNVADATEKPILGLMSEFTEGLDWQRKRHMGHGKDWPEDEMTHLELDGAGGERIVEIGVPKSEVLNGLMVCADFFPPPCLRWKLTRLEVENKQRKVRNLWPRRARTGELENGSGPRRTLPPRHRSNVWERPQH